MKAVIVALGLLWVQWTAVFAAEPARPKPGNEITITPPAKPVQVGQCCRLAVEGLTKLDMETVVVICGPTGATADLLAPVGGSPFLHFSGAAPGRYVVALIVGQRKSQADVQVGGTAPNPTPTPGPTPGPTPNPTPDPTPTPQKLWGLIVVEESKERTPQQASIYTSTSLRQELANRKLEWRLLDKDQSAPGELAQWVRKATAGGAKLPMLFAVTADGKAAYEGALPATDKDVIALIGRVAK